MRYLYYYQSSLSLSLVNSINAVVQPHGWRNHSTFLSRIFLSSHNLPNRVYVPSQFIYWEGIYAAPVLFLLNAHTRYDRRESVKGPSRFLGNFKPKFPLHVQQQIRYRYTYVYRYYVKFEHLPAKWRVGRRRSRKAMACTRKIALIVIIIGENESGCRHFNLYEQIFHSEQNLFFHSSHK